MGTGERIRERRLELHLSQQALAELAGLARVTVGAIERGENEPKLNTLQALAAPLGVAVSDLVGIDGERAEIAEPAPTYGRSGPPPGVIMVRRYRGIPPDLTSEEGEQFVGQEPVPTAIARPGDVLIDVQDDSMDPVFPRGCSILVDPTVTKAYAGEHVLIEVAGKRLIRKLERRRSETWFVAENHAYGSEGVRADGRGDISILGVVVGEYRVHGRRRKRGG